MTPVQRTPWREYLLRGVGIGGFFAVLVFVIGIFNGAAPGVMAIAAFSIVGGLVAFAAITAPLVYPPFAVDFAAGTARMRSKEVPIASITQAWRRLAVGKGSSVVFYRLRSTSGPRVRLVVAGYGFPVLDVAGVQALLDLLRIAPIEEPGMRADPKSQKWRPVGPRQMIAEMKRLDRDFTAGLTEEEIRRDAELDGRDPNDPMLDDQLR